MHRLLNQFGLKMSGVSGLQPKRGPDTLNVVSFEQASKRLLLKLRSCWLRVLESEAPARTTCSMEANSH